MAIYNPYQTAGYPSFMPNTVTPVNNGYNPQPRSQGITWVNGEEAARTYPIPYNSTMMLMDSESPVLYVKTVDSIGRITDFEVYDLINRAPKKEQVSINTDDFVKKADLDKMLASINKRFDDVMQRRVQTRKEDK